MFFDGFSTRSRDVQKGSNIVKRTKKKAGEGVRLKSPGHRILSTWQLHVMILVPVIYLLIFHYVPLYGAQIAFRDYRPRDGIMGSEWVGLKWFQKFLSSYNFKSIFSNTILLSFYQIFVGFPIPIIFALFLNACRGERFKQITQTITYMPHFISIVVLVAILNMLLNPVSGVYGTVYRLLGGDGYPTDVRPLAGAFRHLYVWSDVWQNMGWDTIIYTAALASVSQDNHEAAMLDGASRFQRILHVDLPAILPTIGIMLIMRCGSVMAVGFEKVYLMQNPMNLTVSEVISTHVYKVGMGSAKDMSYAAAIDLFNSVINCILLVTVNYISKKISKDEVSLF